MTEEKDYGFATRSVHAGADPDPATGARSLPIVQSTAFVFKDADHAAALFGLEDTGYIYSRLTNPTVSAFQARVASLEGGVGATCTASGHSAQLLALFALMESGDDFIASNKLYGGSITQFGHTFKKFGWNVIFVDPVDPENFKQAVTPNTKAIFTESLANPGGIVCDIERIAEIAHAAGVPLIVDNTLPSPALCRPIEYGADIVVHSTTKFISGHGNAMGGAVVDSGKFDWAQNDKFKSLTEPCGAYHGLNFYEKFGPMAYTLYGHAVGLRDLGPTMSAMNAYLSITGAETLPLRMRKHADNALEVATFLTQHSEVEWVSYAGLADNPFYALAQKYCPEGAGAVFTFGVKGGYDAGIKVVDKCQLLSHLANIGDTRSLIIHPASTTHRQLTDAQKVAAGAGPEVVRLSIGIEDAKDVMADLDQALRA
ncbi:MAG: O-acetylhomoserine aminocarboxypropyltransferase [Gammaproteobacteria bacterium TMED119]|nr:MAG: O-acetylhomoserine aminocarboxypropyltransferase [Gammaproteobacteria bacterium TMED119]RCL46370.1 MAG: O-acetylhomoserine aminocarboxypropyltransferase [Candidatus Thioglobus sp.]